MRLISAIVVICAMFFVIGCSSTSVTQLGGGFRSYETISDVRNILRQAGLSDQWQEEHRKLPNSDQRPTYEFLTMSGPFTLSGVDGHFKLVFYNGRLMSTEFSTARGSEVIASMRKEGNVVPTKPREDITLGRRTRFRYDVDPDGTFRFSWRDAKLEDEWSKWVGNNA